jgi:hypothetical protein
LACRPCKSIKRSWRKDGIGSAPTPCHVAWRLYMQSKEKTGDAKIKAFGN